MLPLVSVTPASTRVVIRRASPPLTTETSNIYQTSVSLASKALYPSHCILKKIAALKMQHLTPSACMFYFIRSTMKEQQRTLVCGRRVAEPGCGNDAICLDPVDKIVHWVTSCSFPRPWTDRWTTICTAHWVCSVQGKLRDKFYTGSLLLTYTLCLQTLCENLLLFFYIHGCHHSTPPLCLTDRISSRHKDHRERPNR